MDLGYDVLNALPEMRRQAESLMTDTAEVGTWSDGTVLNEATGQYEKAFTAVYTGKCRFKAGDTALDPADAAGQLLVQQQNTISFPIDTSTAIGKDMIVRMLTSTTDPALPGVTARIKGPFVGAGLTARRFPVEVTS